MSKSSVDHLDHNNASGINDSIITEIKNDAGSLNTEDTSRKECVIPTDSAEPVNWPVCVIDNSSVLELPQFEQNSKEVYQINHIVVNTNKNDVYSCTLSSNDLNKNSKGIYLLANFAGKNTAMLIDTGATISVMAKSVFDGLNNKPFIEPSKLKVCSVSGEQIHSYGKAIIPFAIEGKTYFPTFEIVDIPDKIILGMSTMATLNGIIDMKAKRVHLAGVKIPCLILDGQPKLQRVLIARITTVNPGEEMIIPGELGNCTVSNKVFKHMSTSYSTVPIMFEPTNKFCEKSGLLACPAVAMNDSKIAFRVYNPSNKPVVLKKGSLCGFISPVEKVEEVLSTVAINDLDKEDIFKISDTAGDANLPDYLKDMYTESSNDLDDISRKAFRDLIIKYKMVFSKGDLDIGRTNLVKHTIDTGDHAPIKQHLEDYHWYSKRKWIAKLINLSKQAWWYHLTVVGLLLLY